MPEQTYLEWTYWFREKDGDADCDKTILIPIERYITGGHIDVGKLVTDPPSRQAPHVYALSHPPGGWHASFNGQEIAKQYPDSDWLIRTAAFTCLQGVAA